MNGWQQPRTGDEWFRGMEGRMRRIERHKHGISGMMVVDPIDASLTDSSEARLTAEPVQQENFTATGVLEADLPDVPVEFGIGLSFTISDVGTVGSTGRSDFFLKGPVNDFESLGSFSDNEIGDTRYVESEGNLFWWDGLFWQDGGHIQGGPGPQGDPGLGINLVGSVADSSELPEGADPNDAYVTQDTGHLWVWDGEQWVDVGNIKGPQGEQGDPGPRGPQGVIRVLPPVDLISELPTVAAENDLIYVEESGTLYGWNTAAQNWDIVGHLKGADGPAGQDGDAGTGMVLIGTVDTREDLPATGTDVGEAYLVEETSEFAVWGSDSAWHFVAGVEGPRGKPGPPGERGPIGIGTPGKDGDHGIDGKSAYEIFIDEGGEGTEEDWLLSLQGPPGEDGLDADLGAETLLPAIDLILAELIDTQDGNTIVQGENEQRLYVPLTALPGSDAVVSSGDYSVTSAAGTGQVPGMTVSITNPSTVLDLRVQIMFDVWVIGVAGTSLFLSSNPVGAGFVQNAKAIGRAADNSYRSVNSVLYGTIKPGQSADFNGIATITGPGPLTIRYVTLVGLPIAFEVAGSSNVRVYTFPPIGNPPPVPVTTSVSIVANPSTITVGSSSTLTATVTPSNAVGRVQFQYFANNTWYGIGSPAAVSGGKASVVNTPGATRPIRGVFTATDAGKFKNSTSPSITLTVVPKVTDKTATSNPAKNRVATYKGSGAQMTWNWDGRRCYYGYYDGTNGDQRAVALFEQAFINVLRSMPSNSIYDAVLTFTNLHTYANAGGTVRVQIAGDTALPGNQGPISTTNAFNVTVPKSGSVSIGIPSYALMELMRGSGTGFRFGAVTSGTNGYGYLDGLTVKLAVKYRS